MGRKKNQQQKARDVLSMDVLLCLFLNTFYEVPWTESNK